VLSALLVAAWFACAPGGQAAEQEAPKTTVITVTAGKPTELGFKLSRFSNLAPGSFTFTVTNDGAVEHAFKICTTPRTSANANSCIGRATKVLNSGQSQTVKVVLKKPGKYEYLCPLPGHAGAGMKGLLGVGVNVTSSAASDKP
jgi:plastocyanin